MPKKVNYDYVKKISRNQTEHLFKEITSEKVIPDDASEIKTLPYFTSQDSDVNKENEDYYNLMMKKVDEYSKFINRSIIL